MNRIAVAKELVKLAKELTAFNNLYEFKHLSGGVDRAFIDTGSFSSKKTRVHVGMFSGGNGGYFISDLEIPWDDSEARQKLGSDIDADILVAAKKFDEEVGRILAKHKCAPKA